MYNGISINELNTKNFKIDKLYLKLDKKLILNINHIEILKQNSKQETNSLKEIEKIIDFLPILKIFKEIYIENLELKSQNFNSNILFQDDIFFVNLPKLIVISKIIDTKNAEILDANFKDFDLKIAGKIGLNFKKDNYIFDGEVKFYEVSSKIKVEILKNILTYNAFDAKAKSLQNLIDFLAVLSGLPNTAKEWIYGNVVAQKYNLKFLKGKVDLETGKAFLNEMNALAFAEDLNITFNKLVPSTYAKDANITLKDGSLFIDLGKANYQNRKLDGSKVQVKDMFTNVKVIVDLSVESAFDEEIHKILNGYKIFVPITQKNGVAKGKLRLNIDPHKAKVTPIGEFDFNASLIKIGGANFKTNGGKIIINKNILKVKNAGFSLPNLFDSKINAVFNLNKLYADINADFKKFLLKQDKLEILNFKKNLDLKLDFSGDSAILNIFDFDTTLNFGKTNKIEISDLSKILPYSQLCRNLNVKNGKVEVISDDFEKININLKNIELNKSNFYKSGKNLLNLNGNLKIAKNLQGEINFDNNKSKIEIKNSKFTLKNLDFMVETSQNSDFVDDLNFEFINGKIILKDFNRTLSFNKLQGQISKNSLKIKANPSNDADLNISKKNREISLKANNIKSDFLNEIISSKVFQNGSFNANITGNLDNLNGQILAFNTHLKDFVFYHQFLTFLNTIPSLISLNKPDFNLNGMTIKQGEINFTKTGDILNIKLINIIGSTSDIAGFGTINLKTGKINIDLEVFLLKDFSNVISYLPIINQILLGSDRTISTTIKIDGTLKDPKFHTHLTNDILTSPFNIIKNIITLPANLIKTN